MSESTVNPLVRTAAQNVVKQANNPESAKALYTAYVHVLNEGGDKALDMEVQRNAPELAKELGISRRLRSSEIHQARNEYTNRFFPFNDPAARVAMAKDMFSADAIATVLKHKSRHRSDEQAIDQATHTNAYVAPNGDMVILATLEIQDPDKRSTLSVYRPKTLDLGLVMGGVVVSMGASGVAGAQYKAFREEFEASTKRALEQPPQNV